MHASWLPILIQDVTHYVCSYITSATTKSRHSLSVGNSIPLPIPIPMHLMYTIGHCDQSWALVHILGMAHIHREFLGNS